MRRASGRHHRDAMPRRQLDHAKTPPTGTVTFLFSDIEGSTRMVEALGARWPKVLQRHRVAMRRAFDEHGGVERGTEGDSFFVAFPDAVEAVSAAVAATKGLAETEWPDDTTVRVRIGMHTGEGRLVDGDYVGLDVHRAARIAAAGHGGQILISESTRILTERALPPGVTLRDLGQHTLKDLPAPEHLYQALVEGMPSEFPPLRSLARIVANLPAQLSSIIGRDAEIEAVRVLLETSRLVTITGPGGIGKTRVAQEVARRLVATNAGAVDVVFVPLDALTDAALIPLEILRALGLDAAASREPIARLAEHLTTRSAVLVLDNLEQLSGAGLVVKSILDRAQATSVLVSSQAALHVAGEQEYALPPLDIASVRTHGPSQQGQADAMANPALALFVERARAVRADFALDATNTEAILEICTRLDGLPLAIELAAAQVKLLSPAAILERIQATPDALASRREDLPERHRTLRATVAWSYELLGEGERRLFRRLGLFSGGARLPEIEAIAAVSPPVADPVDALGTLVDRSLVTVRRGEGGDDRFDLFQTIRTYARQLLVDEGEEGAIAGEHARIYRDLAHRAEQEVYRRSRREWLRRIDADRGNLRAAFDWLLAAGAVADALELGADLWRFWQLRGRFAEGIERLDRALAAAAAPGAPDVPLAVLSRAEEAAGSLRYWIQPDRRLARMLYEQSLEHAIASGDRVREAWSTYNLAFMFDFIPEGFGEPDFQRALDLRQRALQLFRDAGDQRGIGESLWAMGGSAQLVAQDPVLARQHLNEALPILEEIGDLFAIGWSHISLGLLDSIEGNLDDAEAHVLAAADVFTRDGDMSGEVITVQHLGALAAKRGDDVTAVRFSAAAVAASNAVGANPPPIPPIIDPIRAAEARMAPADLQREREVGRALGMDSILSAALEAWHARSRP
jgi:predicted ATPase/class 3 adenylate cyclase